MKRCMKWWQWLGLLPTLCVICSILLHAQPGGTPPLYRGFQPYDSTKFTMGAITIYDAALARQLHLDYTYLYHTPTDIRSIINDPHPANPEEQKRWRRYLKHGLGVFVEPNVISGIMSSAYSTIDYVGLQTFGVGPAFPDSMHGYTFGYLNTADGIPADSLYGRHQWALHFPVKMSSTNPSGIADPFVMAGKSRGTMEGLGLNPDEMPALAAMGITEDQKSDLAITMKIDPADLIGLPGDKLLAYVLVYKRETTGQPNGNGCRCGFYSQVDSLAITKSFYLNGAHSRLDPNSGYREPTFVINVADLDNRAPVTPTTDIIVDGITVAPAGVPVQSYRIPRNRSWFDWSSSNSSCPDYCDHLFTALTAGPNPILPKGSVKFPGPIESADLFYDVYTANTVPISILRGRLSSHLITMIDTGRFDSYIHDAIDPIFADPGTDLDGHPEARNPADSLIRRLAATGESRLEKYYGERLLLSRMQQYMKQKADERLARSASPVIPMRQIYNNMIGDEAAYRIGIGDLDTTDIRMLHVDAHQVYHFAKEIPITYANPLRMSVESMRDLYHTYDPTTDKDRIDGDGRKIWTRWIMGNHMKDHDHYIAVIDTEFALQRSDVTTAVDVARHRYTTPWYAPYPVWGSVQIQGDLAQEAYTKPDNTIGYRYSFVNMWRPTTPEEITAQCWMMLNCGVDGLYFGDFCYDGSEFGVMHHLEVPSDSSTGYVPKEYDTLTPLDPRTPKPWPADKTLPLTWTGFNSRMTALWSITSLFHDTILPAYNRLDRNGVHIAVKNIASYDAVPLLRSVQTEGASNATRDPAFTPNAVIDAQQDTHMDVTIFKPLPQFEAEDGRDTRYILFTNLRCWPIDFNDYHDSHGSDSLVTSCFQNLSLYPSNDPFMSTGLGNVDVRRPVVKFKNTGTIGDSVEIQKVGSSSEPWVRYNAGEGVPLDWLRPGEGEMYRVRPVQAPIATYGNAYNNAVHTENPSTIDNQAGTVQERDRIVVYERDSSIYLRAMKPSGGWSPELLISGTNEGAGTTGARNMHPAVATARNGSTTMVVWERRTPSNKVSVECAWLPAPPAKDAFPTHAALVGLQLMAPRPMPTGSAAPGGTVWALAAPSIVGVDGGYIVAWTPPNGTVEAVAVRAQPGTVHTYDVSSVLRIKKPRQAPDFRDSAAQYSTLAYRKNVDNIILNGGMLSAPYGSLMGPTIYPPQGGSASDITGVFQVAHLAYQQGSYSGGRWDIMYNRLGVRFPTGNVLPDLWASPTEDVTSDIPACTVLYPSIAADSVHTGVTFTIDQGVRHVGLRFRNDALNTPAAMRWKTQRYEWGGPLRPKPGTANIAREYQRSSLTMFPSHDSLALLQGYEGALTWEWTNTLSSVGRTYGEKLYRLGAAHLDTIPDGRHPTMVLAPFLHGTTAQAMAATGVYHRGTDEARFDQLRARDGKNIHYYPAFLENTPDNPLPAFVQPTRSTGLIYADLTIFGASDMPTFSCARPVGGGGGGMQVGFLLDPPENPTGWPSTPPPFTSVGLPPSFFPKSPDGPRVMTGLLDGSEIARTGVFLSGDSAVSVRRLAVGYDSLRTWLNSQPYDSLAHRPADITFAMQVVRAGDSAVLWTGDTVTARYLGDDTLDEMVSVPVNLAASAPTPVYIRMAATPTAGLHYGLTGGFQFFEADEISSAPGTMEARPVVAQWRESADLPGSALHLRLVPLPITGDRGELTVDAPRGGTAEIEIYDALGQPAAAPADVDLRQQGIYAVPIDVRSLRSGVYTISVRLGQERATARLVIAR